MVFLLFAASVNGWIKISFNSFAWNIAIFGVDNTSSSHTDNEKNNILVLIEKPTCKINGKFGIVDKKININFGKTNAEFYYSLH